jgi:hypothetical protein
LQEDAAPVLDCHVLLQCCLLPYASGLLTVNIRLLARLQEDAAPVLALVDMYGSQPAAAATANGSSSRSHPAAKQRVASLYYVHQGLYSERPSMRILKVNNTGLAVYASFCLCNKWHPCFPLISRHARGACEQKHPPMVCPLLSNPPTHTQGHVCMLSAWHICSWDSG